jgi:hypothetical protein
MSHKTKFEYVKHKCNQCGRLLSADKFGMLLCYDCQKENSDKWVRKQRIIQEAYQYESVEDQLRGKLGTASSETITRRCTI